jgi:hypothetical protein
MDPDLKKQLFWLAFLLSWRPDKGAVQHPRGKRKGLDSPNAGCKTAAIDEPRRVLLSDVDSSAPAKCSESTGKIAKNATSLMAA